MNRAPTEAGRAAPGPLGALAAPRAWALPRGRPSGEAVLLGVLLAVFAALVVPPMIAVVETSFFVTDSRGLRGAPTLANYARLFGRGDLLTPLLNTLGFAAGSTVLALLVGGGLAWIVGRTNTPLRVLGHVVAFVSLAVPFVLYTIAWLLVLGQRGPLNAVLMALLGLDAPPVSANTLWAMILVEGLLWSPLAFLLLSATFQAMDPALEEASMTSGGGVWATMRRVTLPLARPALVSIALLVFIRAFEAFEIPALVGLPGRVLVLTTRVYQSTKGQPPDYGLASAYAVVLMAVVLVALYGYARMTRQASQYQTISGKGFRPRPIDLGRWRYVTGAAMVVYFGILLLIPLALIVWASFMPFYTPPSPDALKLVTLKNYTAVLTQPSFLAAMRNTFVLGVASAAVLMLLAALASWLVVKGHVRGRLLLEQLGALPLVFPGIVLGLAIMQFYLALPLPVYGTLWILGIAYVTRYLPYGMRYANSGLLQIHRELEEAAYTSGGGFWRTYRAVTLPLLAPVLLAGWVFAFLLSTKELSMSVLLTSPRTQVMSVAFFELWNNGQVTEVAAFGVLWAAALSLVTGALYLFARRYGIQVQQR